MLAANESEVLYHADGMSLSLPQRIRFGVFEVDTRSGELRRNGSKVTLQAQPFQVLVLLLERPGEVVTREELTRRLWPANTFVDYERGLNKAINKLRYALRDDAEKPSYIETLPLRGYRFIGSVESVVQADPVEWVSGNNGESPVPPVEPSPVPAVEPPEPEQSIPRRPHSAQRHWKLRAAVVVFATLAVMASLLSLYEESSYVSRTRFGMLARRVVLGARASNQPAVAERRLTANTEDVPVTSAVISPDGKYLAFTDRTGFYLRQVEGGETHAVPLPKGFDAHAESWFPDRVHLVVSWIEDPKGPPSLWAISVMGGTPRRLVEDGFGGRVSPDGSRIAFLRGRFGHDEIWLMQADGEEAHRIVGGTEPEKADHFSPVSWTPNGRRIAYGRTTTKLRNLDERKVEIADIGSGRIEVVLSSPELGRALGWTLENQLVYSLLEPAPNRTDSNLWSVQLDSQTGRPLNSAVRLTNGHGFAAELSVARDGKMLALRRLNPQPDVYFAEFGSDKRLGAPQRLTLDERQDFPYAWMPDSKAILFVSDRDGRNHIYKQAIDQTQPELLVGGNDDLELPRLNPDGKAMLYLVAPKEDDPSHMVRLMRVPLAGGPPQLVLETPGIWNEQCASLPSTLCIYSPSEANQQRFFTFDEVSGAGAEIVAAKISGGGVINWNLSPDGKSLATVQQLGVTQPELASTPEIRILSLIDSSQRTIPVTGWGAICGLDWAADNKNLWVGATRSAFRYGGVDSSALLKVDLDGTVTALIEKGSVGFCAAIPSPDGRGLALFGATTYPSNVWLLENF